MPMKPRLNLGIIHFNIEVKVPFQSAGVVPQLLRFTTFQANLAHAFGHPVVNVEGGVWQVARADIRGQVLYRGHV